MTTSTKNVPGGTADATGKEIMTEEAKENALATTEDPSVPEHDTVDAAEVVKDTGYVKDAKGQENWGKGGVFIMKGGKRVPYEG